VVLTVTGQGGSNTITKGNIITVSSAPTVSAGMLSGSLTSASSARSSHQHRIVGLGAMADRRTQGDRQREDLELRLVGTSSAGTYGATDAQ